MHQQPVYLCLSRSGCSLRQLQDPEDKIMHLTVGRIWNYSWPNLTCIPSGWICWKKQLGSLKPRRDTSISSVSVSLGLSSLVYKQVGTKSLWSYGLLHNHCCVWSINIFTKGGEYSKIFPKTLWRLRDMDLIPDLWTVCQLLLRHSSSNMIVNSRWVLNGMQKKLYLTSLKLDLKLETWAFCVKL